MENTEATNTEGTKTTEEEIVEEETTTDDEESEDSEENEDTNEEVDEEKSALAKKVEELEAKNKSLYEKIKSGYKKHAKTKESTLPKEQVKQIMEEILKEETAERKFLETYEDGKELLTEVKKLKEEK